MTCAQKCASSFILYYNSVLRFCKYDFGDKNGKFFFFRSKKRSFSISAHANTDFARRKGIGRAVGETDGERSVVVHADRLGGVLRPTAVDGDRRTDHETAAAVFVHIGGIRADRFVKTEEMRKKRSGDFRPAVGDRLVKKRARDLSDLGGESAVGLRYVHADAEDGVFEPFSVRRKRGFRKDSRDLFSVEVQIVAPHRGGR